MSCNSTVVTAGRRLPFGNPSLLVTTAVAIVLTVEFDLSRIAALGAFAYLALDMVIHYGHLRHLRHETGAKPAPLVAAIVVDAIVFAGFFGYRIRTDLVVIASFVVFAVLVAVHAPLQRRRRNHEGRRGHVMTDHRSPIEGRASTPPGSDGQASPEAP